MAVRIDMPPVMSGTAETQLGTLYNYLYSLATQVNDALNGMTVDSFVDKQQEAIRKATGINTDGSITEVQKNVVNPDSIVALSGRITQLSTAIGTLRKSLDARIAQVETGKVDKVAGKGLSTEDYTAQEREAVQQAVASVEAMVQNVDDLNTWLAALEERIQALDGA